MFGQVPELSSAFQPRAALRKKIDQARISHTTVVLTQVLRGGGGVGKSQLAAAYAREAQRDGVDMVMWVNATEADQVISLYARAARELQIAGVTGTDARADARRFTEWLAATPRSWLIVLDDIDPGHFDQWWPPSSPQGQGRVYATTRRQDAVLHGGGRTVVEVGVYSEAEAHAYLTEYFARIGKRHLMDDQMDAVCRTLGLLPLALSHAAAYMVQENIPCTKYLTLFNHRRSRLGKLLPRWADTEKYGREVAASLLLNLDAAQQREPVGLALPTLRMAACLDPAGQPHALWTSDATNAYLTAHLPPDNCREDEPDEQTQPAYGVLRLLHSYGLITDDFQAEPRAVHIHALTARATREATPDTTLDTVKAAAADALMEIWPSADHTQPDLRAVLRTNTETLTTLALELLWSTGRHGLLYYAGVALLHAHLRSAGIGYWEGLALDAERVLGGDHPDTLTARNSLATSYHQAGRTSDAIEVLGQVVRDRERILGTHHPDTLSARNSLGACYQHAGRTSDAIEIQEQVVKDSQRIRGSDHPQTLNARNSLAASYQQAGRTNDAIEVLEQVVRDSQRILGSDHPDTLTALANLGACYNEAGRTSDAIGIKEQVVRDRKRILGSDHPDTLTARDSLAVSYHNAGRTSDAIEVLEQVVRDSQRILGNDHPSTLTALGNLGASHHHAGRTSDAIEIQEQVVRDSERILGNNHPQTLNARHSLAVSY
ncbi:tetratricopeptide repeat protein, partial [Streptomyces massasporeus]